MKLCLGFIFLLISLCSLSQTIRVLDKSNLQPIEDVAVFNLDQTKTALTNTEGWAGLQEFSSKDTLFFQHPSYQELILPYQSVKALNFVIHLARSSVNLSEYVVVANKWEQKKDEVPNRITTIKARDLAYLNPQTTADLLGSTHEVFIQKSQLGGGSPMIRGFSANSVLIVVDGVRMNNAIYRSGNLQNVISIDGNILEEAEVIYGPGSIIYGSDALGGVMDFHTRDIKFTKEEDPLIHANGLVRYASASQEKTIHADVIYSGRKWGFITSLTYSQFGDLRMGSEGNEAYRRLHYVERIGSADEMIFNTEPDIQRQSGYNQLNLTQKFSFRLTDNSSLSYGFHLATSSDIPRYDRLIQYDDEDNLRYAEWYYGPQNWMMHMLGLNLNASTRIYDNAKITLAYQDVEESRHDRKLNQSSLRSRTENVDVLSLNVDFDRETSKKGTLFYGIESIYNDVRSEAQRENILNGDLVPETTRYPDGGSKYFTSAVYLNYKLNISRRITLQTGIRYSYVYAKSLFADTSFYAFPYDNIKLNTSALNGGIGLVYRVTEKSRINVNLSSGFRAPNIDDLAKVFDSEPGNVVVPNEDLGPEYAYNADLGFVKNIGNAVVAEITGFATYIADLMVRRDFLFNGQDSIIYDGTKSKVQAIQNAGSGWIAGASMNIRADVSEQLGFYSNLTFIRGKDDEGAAIRHVAPVYGSTGFSYTASKLKIDLYAEYNGALPYKRLAPSERDKPHIYATDADGNPYSPSWYTFNVKGFYQINNKLQVNLGIENLLDHRYRPYSSGIAAPGRNLILALRVHL